MNRLILIGNGFDLAHGLKSRYKDFIFWYLADCLSRAGGYPHIYSDEFIDVYPPSISYVKVALNIFSDPIVGNTTYEEFIRQHYDRRSLIDFLNILPDNNYLSIPINKNDEYNIYNFRIEIKSTFFGYLIYNCTECGWVDIEQEYFKALKKYNDKDNAHDLDYIRMINKHFDFLKKKLEEYLTIQDENYDGIFNPNLGKILGQEFQEDDFDPSIGDDELRIMLGKDYSVENNKTQRKVYVLNFNYTNTFYNYLREIKGNYFTQVEINHIHGQLNNKDNPIIFGFGDEHDKDYALFEEQSNNDLFEHVKSYHYLKTPNYRHLMRFLNEDHFQVFVLGHSCGLSDRTMFKEIFDHENCKSVKILHHKRDDGTTDFFDKTINLGRHFSDKGRMRKLVVNFNEVDAIPQMKKEI
ncbi:AbiH family protein [Sphingobacterium composti Ten et al. 2007 non Yoo et al. 2007]|uniref:AbiH family protein n=1 Tax=Sphingobacterium composti TaxID=363260 RepID=UPI00135981A1|nr:AbiH family protein [Sphingobacterium composti Ten et al. 2007 non Yoo et al. 2007]